MSWYKSPYKVFGFVIFWVLILWLQPVFRYHPGFTVVKLENLIKEEIPLGAPKEQVIEFLKQHKMEFSQYDEDTPKIDAIIRDVCWTALVECDISMKFTFDDSSILRSFSVEEGYTSI